MTERSPRRLWLLALLTLLIGAAALRCHGLGWDQLVGAHPDERYVVGVASGLSLGGGLNPFDAAPRFAYGHLPLYVLALARVISPAVDPLLIGRALSAAFDLGTVALTFALGRRLEDRRVGLLGAAFVALMVAHVQQAHFYTADVLLALLVLAALYFSARFAQEGRERDVWLAGAAAGLALGTKATAGLLVVPLSVSLQLSPNERQEAAWGCALAALLTFVCVDPFAVIELRTFLGNVGAQAAILRGAVDVPYTRQYQGTMPYLYPAVQQLRWGVGWLMGACAIFGLARAGARAVGGTRPPGRSVVLTWVVSYLAVVGGLYAKFPRYVLPVLPLAGIYAARLVVDLGRWRRWLPPTLAILMLAALLLRCLALAAMYRVPHPWVTASAWILEHAEHGSTIAVEAWDHPLPLDAEVYVQRELPVFDEETPEKWDAMDETLEEADYLIIASRRGYGSLARRPARYGRTARMYQRLFEGDLGFEAVACFARYPRLGSLVLADDATAGLPFSLPEVCRPDEGRVVPLGRLDESFVVYDHPQVIVFRSVAARD